MKNIIELLNKYNQEHIVKLMKILSEEQKEEIEKDIKSIDLDKILKLFEELKTPKQFSSENIVPLKANLKEKIIPEKLKEITKKGEDIIKNGKYAVATVAGGQGTRLRM